MNQNISLLLSVECSQEARMAIMPRMRECGLIYKQFLWPSPNVLFYVGYGADKTEQIVSRVSEASKEFAAAGYEVIMFMEVARPGECISGWYCWHNGRQSHLSSDDMLIYTTELEIRDLLLDMVDHPEKYAEDGDKS